MPVKSTITVDWGAIDRFPAAYDLHCGTGALLGTLENGRATGTLVPRQCGGEVAKNSSGSCDVSVVGTNGIVQTCTEALDAGVGDMYTFVRAIGARDVMGEGALEGNTVTVEWSEGPTASFAVDWCNGFLLGVWDDGEGFNVTKENLVPPA